jgi:hypothetical protein
MARSFGIGDYYSGRVSVSDDGRDLSRRSVVDQTFVSPFFPFVSPFFNSTSTSTSASTSTMASFGIGDYNSGRVSRDGRDLSRLSAVDQTFVSPFLLKNPGHPAIHNGQPFNDYNSFAYEACVAHIPLQRSMHQCSSHAYRTNQMVKHAYEDGHLTHSQLQRHTDKMTNMADKQAFEYAKEHLNFKK